MAKPSLKRLARALDNAERVTDELRADWLRGEIDFDDPEYYAARRAEDAAALAYSQAIFAKARVKVDKWRARKTWSTQAEIAKMKRDAEVAERYVDAANELGVSARELQDFNVAFYLADERYQAASSLLFCSMTPRDIRDAQSGIRRSYR